MKQSYDQRYGHPRKKVVRASVNNDARRASALLRQEERGKRSPEEQLNELDRRLGRGVGAKKERARLMAQIVEL